MMGWPIKWTNNYSLAAGYEKEQQQEEEEDFQRPSVSLIARHVSLLWGQQYPNQMPPKGTENPSTRCTSHESIAWGTALSTSSFPWSREYDDGGGWAIDRPAFLHSCCWWWSTYVLSISCHCQNQVPICLLNTCNYCTRLASSTKTSSSVRPSSLETSSCHELESAL